MGEIVKIFAYRVLTMVLVLFFVATIVFVIIHVAPGDPSTKFYMQKSSPEIQKRIAEIYELDKPVLVQYYAFVSNLLKGNFGTSFNYRENVLNVIKPYLKFTITFASISFFIQILFAFIFVAVSILSKNSLIENIFTKLNLLLYSTPVFISSLFLIYLFSFKFNLFPSSGLTSIFTEDMESMEIIFDYVRHLTLPMLASVFVGLPIYYKYLLESVKGNMNKNYIKNLKVFGVTNKSLFMKHIIPNSLNSFISIAGIEFGVLLSGSVILESIFALPGLGRLTLSAVLTRDYPLVIGAVIISAIMILFVNFIADILRVVIDRRETKEILS